jgi:hypothetical protein
MPTVLRHGPYKFAFFSSDRSEPPHVHVLHGRRAAKFWLDPVSLVKNRGFADHELNRVSRLTTENRTALLEAWRDFFGA